MHSIIPQHLTHTVESGMTISKSAELMHVSFSRLGGGTYNSEKKKLMSAWTCTITHAYIQIGHLTYPYNRHMCSSLANTP